MLCITFDNFGCAANLGYGQGKIPPQARPSTVPLSEWENYNEIGLALGHPRIRGVLSELGIRGTFFAEGYAAVLHPTELKGWSDEGHEIGLHGWKHEIWANIESADKEERLVALSMYAMREVLGDKAPKGFRGPGFVLNPWSEDILEANGIEYVSQVSERSQEFSDKFKDLNLGIAYPGGGQDIKLTRLKFSPCWDEFTDTNLVAPEYGGFFGTRDPIEAYDFAYNAAVKHQSETPDEPWVFVAHPMRSGNRAWLGFDRFIRRLHATFGSDAFVTTGEVALA